MKKQFLSALSILGFITLISQEVNQKVLIEHFTNTRCSICASTNPSIFNLLDDYEEVHIAYYPSSPYSSCVFSMHNQPEADARTNFYGLFGGTPRVVVNGDPVASLQASRMDSETMNTTPFTITVSHNYYNADSVVVNVSISTVANTSISTLKFHAMIAEKLVEYSAPNGEVEHPNVFRKTLYGINGNTFNVASNGNSVEFQTGYTFDPDWQLDDLEIIAFIQDENTKEVMQAEVSTRLGEYTGSPTSVNTLEEAKIRIYPNPVNHYLTIKSNSQISKLSIYNILGNKVLDVNTSSSTIDVSTLKNGLYFIQVTQNGKKFIQKFNKI